MNIDARMDMVLIHRTLNARVNDSGNSHLVEFVSDTVWDGVKNPINWSVRGYLPIPEDRMFDWR